MSEKDPNETWNGNPNTAEAEKTGPESGSASKRRTLIFAVIIVIVVIAIVIGTGVYLTRHRHSMALNDCSKAYQAYTASVSKQKDAKKKEETIIASISSQDVADPKIYTAFTKVVKEEAGRTDVTCKADQDTGLLGRNKDELLKATDTNTRLIRLYKTSGEKVEASIKEKKLADGKQNLEDTITSASSLLGESDGKVADGATRDNLSKAIDAAKQVSAKKDVADPTIYTDAKQSLDQAVKAVNDSISQKQAADQAAAEQARNAAPAPVTGGAGTGYTGNGYRGTGSYRGNGNSSAGANSAPSQQVNPGGSSNNDDSVELHFCGTSDGKEFTPC